MTRSAIQSTFVQLFANATKQQAVTESEVLLAEKELATTFPRSYLDFITTYGAVWTPSILDLVTGGESEVAPEGASWDAGFGLGGMVNLLRIRLTRMGSGQIRHS